MLALIWVNSLCLYIRNSAVIAYRLRLFSLPGNSGLLETKRFYRGNKLALWMINGQRLSDNFSGQAGDRPVPPDIGYSWPWTASDGIRHFARFLKKLDGIFYFLTSLIWYLDVFVVYSISLERLKVYYFVFLSYLM